MEKSLSFVPSEYLLCNDRSYIPKSKSWTELYSMFPFFTPSYWWFGQLTLPSITSLRESGKHEIAL